MIIKADRTQEQADQLKALRKDLFTATERCISLRRDMTTAMTAYENAQAQYERLRSPRQNRYLGDVLGQAITLAETEITQQIEKIQMLAKERIAAAIAAGQAEELLLNTMTERGEGN